MKILFRVYAEFNWVNTAEDIILSHLYFNFNVMYGVL